MITEQEFSYLDIQGWFDWENLYANAVWSCVEPAHFVEVGVCFGKSMGYLATEVARSGKDIRLTAIDYWPNNHTYNKFFENMVKLGVNHLIEPIRCDSIKASELFSAKSIDFCLIDGDHRYNAVKKDITAWLPKVKPFGTIAFHDVHLESVRKALDELIGLKSGRIWKNTFVYEVKGN